MPLFNFKKDESKSFDLKNDISIAVPKAPEENKTSGNAISPSDQPAAVGLTIKPEPTKEASKEPANMPVKDALKPAKEPANKPKEEDSGNVYTNLFEKPEAKKEDAAKSDIISGVFAKEAKEAKKDKILGALPELQTTLTGSYDPSKRNLKLAITGFISVVLVSLLILGFFYAELNPKFDLLAGMRGPNTIQHLTNSRTDIIAMQTAINQKNYLLLNFYLQELSYLSDSYSAARSKPGNAATTELQNKILVTYENAQSVWKEPKTASTIPAETFDNELKKNFQAELANLKKEAQTDDILSQIKDYENTLGLVGNKKLGSFFNKNTDDIRATLPMDDTKLYALTTEALGSLNNEFSVLSELKKNRMPWADSVNEIEKITKSVDTLYNTGFYEELGGIQYASYNFNGKNSKIVISGEARRDDGSTFTLIANLIEALEKSPMFVNVDNRTYPKSGSPEEGYKSSFKIEFNVERADAATQPLT